MYLSVSSINIMTLLFMLALGASWLAWLRVYHPFVRGGEDTVD